MSEKLKAPALLTKQHDHSTFDSGKPPLDVFLKKHALANLLNGSSRTYVATRGSSVVGYYSLAFGSVFQKEAPLRVSKGLPKHPIPILLLARLAVDRSEQGKGLGRGLLKDALLRTIEASNIAGLRAMLVHAKDEEARSFYTRFGFEPSPTDKFKLFLLMKDIRKAIS